MQISKNLPDKPIQISFKLPPNNRDIAHFI